MVIMPYCPDCGKKIPTGTVICPSCGKSLNAAQPPTAPAPGSTEPLPQSVVIPISYQIQTAAVPFEAKASRLELFVRIVWEILIDLVLFIYSLVYGIILLFYGIIAGILHIINWFIILITARRWKTAFDWQAKLIQKSATYYARLISYTMQRAPYLRLMTDQRPSLEMESEPSTTQEKPSA